jgi:hypothetical protein
MCATGSTPLGGIIPVEPLEPVDPLDPLGPADDPLDAVELPGMLEPLPVEARGLPMSPVQPAQDAIKPAKEAPMKSRDDSCVTRFTSVDRASSTPLHAPR